MLKRAMGYTLVEVMVVVIIIGVLAVISVPIYTGYVASAKASEGQGLVQSVAAYGKIYYGQRGDLSTFSTAVAYQQVNPAANRYFTAYTVSGQSGTTFTVSTTSNDGSNITVTLSHDQNATPMDNVTTTGA